MSQQQWSWDKAEEYLLSRELFGMSFDLNRMKAVAEALGRPQDQFDTIHLVGTNGKSSTTRMAAAILEAHGVASGLYCSPHLTTFAERISIASTVIEPAVFGAAVMRAAQAAQIADLKTSSGPITQFEALTVAAYDEFSLRGVEVAVVEAGLGGRLDATNILGPGIVGLTSIGLEHTALLGTSIAQIASEKLAVVKDGGTLVVRQDLDPDVMAEAQRVVCERDATIVVVDDLWQGQLAATGAYQRGNFTLAVACCEAYLGELDSQLVAEVASKVTIPGRFEIFGYAPLRVLDGAHNPAAIEVTLGSFDRDIEIVAVVSLLEDKDALAMLELLLNRCSTVILTSNSNPRAVDAARLGELAAQMGAGLSAVIVESDPIKALESATVLAGPERAVLVTGSLSLVADLSAQPLQPRRISKF